MYCIHLMFTAPWAFTRSSADPLIYSWHIAILSFLNGCCRWPVEMATGTSTMLDNKIAGAWIMSVVPSLSSQLSAAPILRINLLSFLPRWLLWQWWWYLPTDTAKSIDSNIDRHGIIGWWWINRFKTIKINIEFRKEKILTHIHPISTHHLPLVAPALSEVLIPATIALLTSFPISPKKARRAWNPSLFFNVSLCQPLVSSRFFFSQVFTTIFSYPKLLVTFPNKVFKFKPNNDLWFCSLCCYCHQGYCPVSFLGKFVGMQCTWLSLVKDYDAYHHWTMTRGKEKENHQYYSYL